MSYRYGCSHLSTIRDVIPNISIFNTKKRPACIDCHDYIPELYDLYICLHRDCLKIVCSAKVKDHATIHNKVNPSHAIQMNMSTQHVWCYECKSEVFIEPVPTVSYGNDSDQEVEDCPVISRDSGMGSYNTIRTNSSTSEKSTTFAFDHGMGSNINMSGDTTESSDGEDSNSQSERPFGLVGLQNIGNTCYMNAALQALSNTIPLTSFFLECPAVVKIISEGRKPGLSRTYQALIADMWKKKNGGYVTPSGILYGIRNVHPMFRGYHQHDTQEFLRNFMDQLHEELKQISPPEPVSNDVDTFCMAMDDPSPLTTNYDSSEGEYETCDSGVSERSSLSDDNDRPTNTAKRRLSRSTSPSRRMRSRIQSTSVIESQPSSTSSSNANSMKKQTRYRSIISDIFDGKLLSSVQCLTCNRISTRIETFQDLSLPIPSKDHLVMLHGRNAPSGVTCTETVIPTDVGWVSWLFALLKSWFYGPTVTLHDCLAAFFSTDELKGDNMYSCEKCNKLRNGIKFSKVLQLPEVLCIHLKRFRHELMFSSKISAAVSFPLKGLDMRTYLHSDCTSHVTNYELFSVICHHGTAGGGHYTCFALNSGQWYEFDDQCVTKVSADTVQSCEAYVLFYRKVTTTVHEMKAKAKDISSKCLIEDVVYISRQWFNRFNTCAEPGPIDNSDYLCHHGAVNPERAGSFKQLAITIPREVYEFLHKKFGGCPPLLNIHICPSCQALNKRLVSEMERFCQLNWEFQNQEEPPTHLLSMAWYTQWHNFVQKRTQEPPGPIDNSKVNQNDPNSDYAEINEAIWSFFYSNYGGGPEMRIKPLIMPKSNSETNVNENPSPPPIENDEADEELFYIPNLKRNDDIIITNGGSVNKNVYCSGDPIDKTDSLRETPENDECSQNDVTIKSHDDYNCYEKNMNHTPKIPPITDDESNTDEKVIDNKENVKHRRRKRENTNK